MQNEGTNDNTESKQLISKHQFCFDIPLYKVLRLDEIEHNFMEGDVDGYNAASEFETTFEIMTKSLGASYTYYSGFYLVTLTCKRNGSDKIRFFIYKNDVVVVKHGQFPSLADIQFAEIGKKYDKVLDDESLYEFKRAIGLAAHGVGAGSFVYLRRIFEKLITQTYSDNKGDLEIEKQDFITKRMEDKVELLKDYLPSQLIEMKSVYSILSKGVHELSEQKCLAYFEPLKLSIELILDQKIEMDVKQKRDQKVKQEILNIHKNLGK
jgi:hypothetical protein